MKWTSSLFLRRRRERSKKIIEFESGSCHSRLEASPAMLCGRGWGWWWGKNAFCTLRWLEEIWKEPARNYESHSAGAERQCGQRKWLLFNGDNIFNKPIRDFLVSLGTGTGTGPTWLIWWVDTETGKAPKLFIFTVSRLTDKPNGSEHFVHLLFVASARTNTARTRPSTHPLPPRSPGPLNKWALQSN